MAVMMMVSNGSGAGTTETAHGQIATAHVIQTKTEVYDTEAVVREYFSDIPVMVQVARCESTFRHTLADGTVLRGYVDNRDTGVMQINTYYHGKTAAKMNLDLEDIQDNMAYARHLYETQGTQPWSASRPCWGRSLASL